MDQTSGSAATPSLSWKVFAGSAAVGVVPIAMFLNLPMGLWAEVDELPLHPLVIHGVIVVLPATAIWFVLAAWRPNVLAALVLAPVFLRLVRRVGPIDRVVAVLGTLVAVALFPLTYLAGHSGAEAVWQEAYAEAREPIATDQRTCTLAEVERRNTPAECWAIVDGVVDDVTSFISRHPAGPGDIERMCGRDASDSFLGQQQGQAEPEEWLATLRSGIVVG